MRRAASVLAVALAALAPAASAQTAPPRRVVGFGGGMGLGGEGTSVGSTHLSVLPLNFEARVALTPRFELAAWVPVGTLLYANLAGQSDNTRRSFAWFDVFATWYPLRDAGGFFVAPGLGLLYGSGAEASGVGVEIPARVGWEFTGDDRSFGRALALRPWVDVVFPAGNVDVGARYGVFVEFTLIGYATRAAR